MSEKRTRNFFQTNMKLIHGERNLSYVENMQSSIEIFFFFFYLLEFNNHAKILERDKDTHSEVNFTLIKLCIFII